MDSNVLFGDDVSKIREYLSVHPKNINILSEHATPLMYTVIKQRLDVIDCLIHHRCGINFQNIYGCTALHYACCSKNINRDIVERLISNGASGLLKDNYGRTALHHVVVHTKDVNIIYQLLFVSDPNSLNHYGETALLQASCNKNIEIISTLLNVTYDINLENIDGETTLYDHCRRNNYKVIKLLLSFGADPFINNIFRKIPYNIADEEGKRIIDEYLISQK